jgi:tetratricopeptide (TPR) repeat protein
MRIHNKKHTQNLQKKKIYVKHKKNEKSKAMEHKEQSQKWILPTAIAVSIGSILGRGASAKELPTETQGEKVKKQIEFVIDEDYIAKTTLLDDHENLVLLKPKQASSAIEKVIETYERTGDIQAIENFLKQENKEEYYNEALNIAENSTDFKLKSEIFYIVANYKRTKENPEYLKAIKLFENSLNTQEHPPQKETIIYILIGLCQRNIGEFQKAKESLDTAYTMAEKENNQKLITNILSNRANILADIGKFEESIQDFQSVKNIYEQDNNDNQKAQVLINIGAIYIKKGDLEKAEDATQEAFEIYTQKKDIYGIIECYENFGDIYIHRKEYEKAEEYFQKAFETTQQNNIQKKFARAHGNLGFVYFYEKKYPQAIEEFEEALKYPTSTQEKLQIYEILEKAYNENDNFEKACLIRKEYDRIKEKISQERNKTLNDINIDLEQEKNRSGKRKSGGSRKEFLDFYQCSRCNNHSITRINSPH